VGVLNVEGLKVELGFPSVEDPLIPPGRGFKITKYLNLAYFVNESKSIDACSEFEV
jgi:hypothetical protein